MSYRDHRRQVKSIEQFLASAPPGTRERFEAYLATEDNGMPERKRRSLLRALEATPKAPPRAEPSPLHIAVEPRDSGRAFDVARPTGPQRNATMPAADEPGSAAEARPAEPGPCDAGSSAKPQIIAAPSSPQPALAHPLRFKPDWAHCALWVALIASVTRVRLRAFKSRTARRGRQCVALRLQTITQGARALRVSLSLACNAIVGLTRHLLVHRLSDPASLPGCRATGAPTLSPAHLGRGPPLC